MKFVMLDIDKIDANAISKFKFMFDREQNQIMSAYHNSLQNFTESFVQLNNAFNPKGVMVKGSYSNEENHLNIDKLEIKIEKFFNTFVNEEDLINSIRKSIYESELEEFFKKHEEYFNRQENDEEEIDEYKKMKLICNKERFISSYNNKLRVVRNVIKYNIRSELLLAIEAINKEETNEQKINEQLDVDSKYFFNLRLFKRLLTKEIKELKIKK